MDGLKPSTLSIETNYEDWLDFQKRFRIWAKACYESVDPVDITYEEWSRLLLSAVDAELSRRVDFDAFNTIEELIGQIDAEMQLLRPLHLRRINLIKITHNKGETCSNLLRRFMEGAKVSDLPTLSPREYCCICSLTSVQKGMTIVTLKTKHWKF